jgi:hypothetical protein
MTYTPASLPTIGQPNTTEDPKILSALQNVNAAGVSTSAKRRGGYVSIPDEESTSEDSYQPLTTPDLVSDVEVESGDIVLVTYQALWRATGSAKTTHGRAAVFVDEAQLTSPAPSGPAAQEAILISPSSSSSTGDALVTTGASGIAATTASADSGNDLIIGSVTTLATCAFTAGTPGTCSIGVRFRAVAGQTIHVKNRRLWVWTRGFQDLS